MHDVSKVSDLLLNNCDLNIDWSECDLCRNQAAHDPNARILLADRQIHRKHWIVM